MRTMNARRLAIEAAAEELYNEFHSKRNQSSRWDSAGTTEQDRNAFRVVAALPSTPPRFNIPPP